MLRGYASCRWFCSEATIAMESPVARCVAPVYREVALGRLYTDSEADTPSFACGVSPGRIDCVIVLVVSLVVAGW